LYCSCCLIVILQQNCHLESASLQACNDFWINLLRVFPYACNKASIIYVQNAKWVNLCILLSNWMVKWPKICINLNVKINFHRWICGFYFNWSLNFSFKPFDILNPLNLSSDTQILYHYWMQLELMHYIFCKPLKLFVHRPLNHWLHCIIEFFKSCHAF
jgi:hypothetical protein